MSGIVGYCRNRVSQGALIGVLRSLGCSGCDSVGTAFCELDKLRIPAKSVTVE